MGFDPESSDRGDTNARFDGPVAPHLPLIFAEDWYWATNEVLIQDLNWEARHASEDMTATIVPTDPSDEMEVGARFFFSAISSATRRVWIASPYFVPETGGLTALKHAALRGVDARILVPEVIDHEIPWLAVIAFFDEIRAASVQAWRDKPGFMHQKMVPVDDEFAAIGTTNLVNRSFRLNFKAMAVFLDTRQTVVTAAVLDKTPPEQLWRTRVGAPIARLFAPVL